MRPARSVFAPVAEASAAARGEAATPAAQRIVPAVMVSEAPARETVTAASRTSVTVVVERDVHAEGGERLPGLRGQLRRVRGQDARPPFDEEDAGVGRVDRPELAAQRVARNLAERTRELDTRRAGPDDHEREQRPPLGRIRRRLRTLEREQDAAPHLERVLERLQARRRGLPVVVPEVVMAHAGGDDRESRTRTRRSPSGRGGRRRRIRSPLRGGRVCSGCASESRAAARRCWRATGRPSPPGRAAAGTGESSSGRGR